MTARGDVSLLEELAADRGTTPDALALAAVLAEPWADVVLSGAATVEVLRSNLAALDLEYDGELGERLGVLREDRDAYWGRRAALRWN